MLIKIYQCNFLRSHFNGKTQRILVNYFAKDYSSSDDEKPPTKKDKKTQPAVEKSENQVTNRLNELLASMTTDEKFSLKKKIVAIPSKKPKSSDKEQKMEKQEKSDNIEEAAKSVASSLGGDVKQTESELLMKLLKISSSLDTTAEEGTTLNNIIAGMKIDRGTKQPQETMSKSQFVKSAMNRQSRQSRESRGEQYRQTERRQQAPLQPVKISGGSVDFFNGEPLNIFKNITNLKESVDSLTTWEAMQERELKLAVTHPPTNYFQKMALWTEQGKYWKFPIDNEQGLDDEAKIDFADHIFLEVHLEGWCPDKGPIRHFMELVCVGLSKNPYLTVKEKQAHIYWFRDYFEQKKDLLKDIIIQDATPTDAGNKQIEK